MSAFYYTVTQGILPGIYTEMSDCMLVVQDQPAPQLAVAQSLHKAFQHMIGCGFKKKNIRLYTPQGVYRVIDLYCKKPREYRWVLVGLSEEFREVSRVVSDHWHDTLEGCKTHADVAPTMNTSGYYLEIETRLRAKLPIGCCVGMAL